MVVTIDDELAAVSHPLMSLAVMSPDIVSRRSLVGLNAANFFLTEITGVVMPFLGAFLKGKESSETAIGLSISVAGLGVFLVQTPAGRFWMASVPESEEW